MHVTHNADDMQQTQVSVHIPELNALAYRVFIGPILPPERLADDSRMRRIGLVAGIKRATLEQRDTHCRKIAGSGQTILRITRLRRVVINQKCTAGRASGKRQAVDAAGGRVSADERAFVVPLPRYTAEQHRASHRARATVGKTA